MLALIGFIAIYAVYLIAETLILLKVFPALHRPQLIMTLVISSVLAFFGVVLNGMIPPIPLNAGDIGDICAGAGHRAQRGAKYRL